MLNAKFICASVHTNKNNVGNSLTKYTIILLIYIITENILATKPMLFTNSFKKARLFPWDPSMPNMTQTKHSQIYTEDKSLAIEKVITLLWKLSSFSL